MKHYTVEYKEWSGDKVKSMAVPAQNKEQAYDIVVWDILDGLAYSAWVAGVTYNNGNYHRFNTFEGKRY